jgi:vancomycin resistance protein YoaR
MSPTSENAQRIPSLPERLGKFLRALAKKIARDFERITALSKRKALAALAIFAAILIILPGLLGAFGGSAAANVAGGVRVGELDVSRFDRRALRETLGKKAQELEKRALWVRVSGKTFSLEPRAVGFRIDVEKTTESAFAAGRRGNVGSRFFGVYGRFFSPVSVELASSLDAAELSKALSRWEEASIPDRAFAGGVEINGTKAVAKKPSAGRTMDRAGAERAMRRALVAFEARVVELPVARVPAPLPEGAADEPAREAQTLVQAPIVLVSREPDARVELSPNEIGTALSTEARPPKILLIFPPERLEKVLAEAKKRIELEAVDAKFEIDQKEKISVVPSRAGLRIDLAKVGAALTAAAKNPDRTGELPLVFEPKPNLTTEEAEKLGIRGLVSSFTTRHPCCEKRVENIHRIADIMNGKVVRPGETVSVNALVGPRTLKTGFVLAPTIEEGEIVDSIGGGISQFATTFFNALFHGGYEIVERQPHTYWFPRYPMGHEATLSWPKPDVIFKNDTAAGMVFKTSYTGTSITVRIYGDNGGRKVRAEVSGRKNVVEPAVEIVPNPHVAPDEEKVKEPGSVGWSVIVSRILTFPDGTTREDKRRVTYKPRPKRIEVHPCRIPKGDKGYTGERCPEPEDVLEVPEAP